MLFTRILDVLKILISRFKIITRDGSDILHARGHNMQCQPLQHIC